MGIQTRQDRERFSRLRQALFQLARDVARVIRPYRADQPTLKGSLYELKRKCGKPGCRCAQGALHPQMVLSEKIEGRTRLRSVPSEVLAKVQRKVRTYQELRRARVELIEVHKRMLAIMDEMESMRREDMSRE